MGANVWPVNAVTGSPTYQGRALRQTTVAPFVAGQTAARPAGSFSGVRPNTATTIATATSTTWTVTPFGGIVDGEALNVAGPYSYFFDTNQTGSVTAAAGSARIDRLDVQVSDPAESDGSSTPAIAIIYTAGTPGSGVPPTQAVRSHPLALINVPLSGGGSPTVTWNATYAASAGGILPATSSTTYPTASSYPGQYLDDLTTGTLKRSNGTSWLTSGGSSVPIIPTITATGGTSAVGADGTITASGAVTVLRWNADKTLMSTFRRVNVVIDYEASVTALHSTRLADGSSIQSTAATYLGQGALVTTGTVSSYNPSAGSSWNDISNAQRKSHRLRYSIAALAVASETAVQVTGSVYDASQVNLIEILGAHQGHTQLAAYDGMEFTFTYASGSMTALTIRITGEV